MPEMESIGSGLDRKKIPVTNMQTASRDKTMRKMAPTKTTKNVSFDPDQIWHRKKNLKKLFYLQ